MRYESSSFKVRLLSSALCYPGMSLHNPTGMAMLSNLSVSLLAVGFSLSSFYIFCSVYEKRIFILNPFVNVHLSSQRVLVSRSWYFHVVCLIHLVHVNGQKDGFVRENAVSMRGWLRKQCEGFYPDLVFDLWEVMRMHIKCELCGNRGTQPASGSHSWVVKLRWA